MTSSTTHPGERPDPIGNMPAPLSALPRRRQDAVQRSLAGERLEAICRELGCATSWWSTWQTRYEAPEPPWSQEPAGRPRTTPTTTPAAVDMASVRLRGPLSPGVRAQVLRAHVRRHQGASRPSRRPIARLLTRDAQAMP